LAIDYNPYNLRPYIIKGLGFVKLNKTEDALLLWRGIVTKIQSHDRLIAYDIALLDDITNLIRQHSENNVRSDLCESSALDAAVVGDASVVDLEDEQLDTSMPISSAITMKSNGAEDYVSGLPEGSISKEDPEVIADNNSTDVRESTEVIRGDLVCKNADIEPTSVVIKKAEINPTPVVVKKEDASSSSSAGKGNKESAKRQKKVGKEPSASSIIPSAIALVESSLSSSTGSASTKRTTDSSPGAAPSKTPSSITASAKEQALQGLKDFHGRTIGMTDRHPIRPFYLVSMRENLPQLSGEPILDDLVCVAYININTGKDDVAINIFNLIMQYRTDLPSVCIGLGSIYAMQRKFDDAIQQFSNAIDLSPTLGEAYKRRGQTRAAKGQTVTALKDLTKAVSLCGGDSGDSHFQRGLLFHQIKNYTKAIDDFREALRRGKVQYYHTTIHFITL